MAPTASGAIRRSASAGATRAPASPAATGSWSATCGDGFVQAGVEQCDDGNLSNADGCLNTCRNAVCGDGFVWAGVEDCEGSATRACFTSCLTVGAEGCASCRWSGTCTPPAEACNGSDDDCDGLTDEGCGSCAACPGATNVSGDGRYTGTLVAGSSGHTGTCGGSGAEVVFTFTTSEVRDVFVTSHASAFDTPLYVRDCTCAGAERACSDDADGYNTSVLFLRDLPAGTYNVFLDAKTAGGGGAWQLDIYFSAPGATGDRCGDPVLIPAGATSISGTILGFTADCFAAADAACTYSSAREDRVYYFYLPTSRAVTFNGCAGTGYRWDQIVYVRRVCDNGELANQAACNDDDACGGNRNFCDSGYCNSGLTATLGPGLFYFFVDGYRVGNACDTLGNYIFTLTGF